MPREPRRDMYLSAGLVATCPGFGGHLASADNQHEADDACHLRDSATAPERAVTARITDGFRRLSVVLQIVSALHFVAEFPSLPTRLSYGNRESGRTCPTLGKGKRVDGRRMQAVAIGPPRRWSNRWPSRDNAAASQSAHSVKVAMGTIGNSIPSKAQSSYLSLDTSSSSMRISPQGIQLPRACLSGLQAIHHSEAVF